MQRQFPAQSVGLDDARRMVAFIPADDRSTWLKIGMALKSEFGDAAFPVWDAWSQNAENYNAKDVAHVWRSFKDGAVGFGTLIHIAKTNGWSSDKKALPLPPLTNPKPAPKQKTTDTHRYAVELWLAANPCDRIVSNHPYAQKKGISWAAGAARGIASGKLIGKKSDCIIVPIYCVENRRLQGVQCINSRGEKQTFGKVSGGCLLLGNTLNKRVPWYVAEGWASAVSMTFHHHKGHAVCAASFGKSQLENTAKIIAKVHQPDEIIILEEVDQ